MSDTADRQLNRIVQLVAELSRREQAGEELARIGDLAASFGVSARQIEHDLRTLTALSDDPEHEWLSSLSVVQEGDQIALSSRGHFRRPIRFTPDELLAIQVGLAEEPDGAELSAGLAALLGKARPAVSAGGSGPSHSGVMELARRAAHDRRLLEIVYAAPGDEPARRVIEVHELLGARGHFYLISWCRMAGSKRHFRADRVLEAKLLEEHFEPRHWLDGDVVYQADASERVKVRFAPGIARWIAEEHPVAERDGEGGAVVDFEVSDPAWLVRTVLGYGDQAEVVAPIEYRNLIRDMTT